MSRARLSAVLLLFVGAVLAGAGRPGASPQGASSGTSTASSAGQGQGQGDSAAQKQDSAGRPADAAGQPPTFRGDVNFIRVDVFVSDRSGRPVTDLEQADFEVIEDGKGQTIEQFSVIRIDGTAVASDERPRQIRSVDDEQAEAARDDVRVFVIFLDDYHVRDRNAPAARAALTRFIETQLAPTDMVAIMYPMTPSADVVFTRDHQAVIRALQRFEGVKYKYEPRNGAEREIEREPPDVIEMVRNQIVYSALEALTYRLGGLRDGRKQVIFVSEGLTTLLPPQLRRANQYPVAGAAAAASDPRVEADALAQAEANLHNRMRDIYKAANRNNTAFYPLDPRGLAPFEFDINDGGPGAPPVDQFTDARTLRSTQDTLRDIAIETGGRAIINRNTLAEGLAEMLRDSSHYYLLGYTTQAPPDGKFHEIRVRVKRSGVDVRARKGYWAYTLDDIKRLNSPTPELARPIQQALATLAAPTQAARYVRTWVGTERGEGGKTRVTLIWEPLPLQPNVRREEAGRVSLMAIDGEGGLVFRGRSPEGAPPVATPGTPSRLGPQRVAFDAPPGRLDLKLQIEAAGGGTIDDETRTIEVPDFTPPQARLSTPKVFRSRNAREFQIAAADAAAVPVASREFSRTERLLIRFDAYGPGSEKPVATAALLGRNGQKIADLPVADAKAGGTHQIDLALSTTAPGDYLVEITVKDSAGAEAQELVALRVGP